MSRIFKVALKLQTLSGALLILLVNKIIAMMTGNGAVPAPNPTLVNLGNDATAYATAKANLETAKSNLKAAAADEKAKRKTLEMSLTNEARYVDSVAMGDKTIIESCGMNASDEPSPVHIEPVDDLSLTRGDDQGSVDGHWQAIVKSNGYTIEISHTAPDEHGVAPWAFYSNSTKSSITITGQTSGSNLWVRVRANGAGDSHGGYSDPAMLIVP